MSIWSILHDSLTDDIPWNDEYVANGLYDVFADTVPWHKNLFQ